MSERRSVTREELAAALLAGDFTVKVLDEVDLSMHSLLPDQAARAIFDALPATPPASETVDAAWKALIIELDEPQPGMTSWGSIQRHRPRIEAAIRAEAGTLDVRTDGDGYEIRVWQTHQPSGVVVLKGHPQLGGRYCLTDGGDWPCATARGAIARLAEDADKP